MLRKFLYSLWIIFFITFALYVVRTSNSETLLSAIENRTFDLRQSMIINSGYKKPSEDIVIVAIDDASYEYVTDKFGEWPIPREIYVSALEYIEAQNPKAVVFDLMFVKSLKSPAQADDMLADMFKKYDNIYTAMNLDNQSSDLRVPADLPDKFSVNVNNLSKNVDFSGLTFHNCRMILQGILDSTDNVGMINVSRADDGIIRKMPVFLIYRDKYYPQLALRVAVNLFGNKANEFVINKNSKLISGSRKIYIDNDGSAILNWYGGAGTYKNIPFYTLMKDIENKKAGSAFTDKIVYFGTTASSLFDIKTTPSAKIYPGVEIQATYLNNYIDNNFIARLDKKITLAVEILLAIITGFIVMNVTSSGIISLSVVSMYSIYVVISYFAMKYFNLWVDIVYPVTFGIIIFISAFIVKYIIKSRDFDHQYKLATTDGLTELYNHRYFQEQMRMQVEQSKRYGTEFSLIILDIDFFKQFNDTFGHQAGDAVLKQVAQMLKSNVRSTDIVCRYGGEEISIILPNSSKETAKATAEKICKLIAENKFKLNNNRESNVTISLGVSAYPSDGDNASDLIDIADKRLYQSKHNGRNQVN